MGILLKYRLAILANRSFMFNPSGRIEVPNSEHYQ